MHKPIEELEHTISDLIRDLLITRRDRDWALAKVEELQINEDKALEVKKSGINFIYNIKEIMKRPKKWKLIGKGALLKFLKKLQKGFYGFLKY